jgi:hypothetical protein
MMGFPLMLLGVEDAKKFLPFQEGGICVEAKRYCSVVYAPKEIVQGSTWLYLSGGLVGPNPLEIYFDKDSRIFPSQLSSNNFSSQIMRIVLSHRSVTSLSLGYKPFILCLMAPRCLGQLPTTCGTFRKLC